MTIIEQTRSDSGSFRVSLDDEPLEPLDPEPPAAEQQSQGPAPNSDEATPHPELGTPYLAHHASTQAHERWLQVQAAFVDDPRRSVAEAHQLVSELMQRIASAFADERAELERQWSSGQQVSTEDLRICLQRYRAFFSRLLPSVPGE
jgi:hypothetical protein